MMKPVHLNPAPTTCRRTMTRGGNSLAAIGALALCAAFSFTQGCSSANDRLLEPIHKSTAAWELRRAEDLALRERDSDAIDAFQSAIRHDPRCAAAHAGLARLREKQDAFDLAATHYRAAVKLDPLRHEYAMALAHCLRNKAMHDPDPRATLSDAIRAYQYAESLDRTKYEPVLYIGICYRLLGDVDRALDHLRRAVALNPAVVLPHIEKAVIHQARNEYRNALAEYRRALEIDPSNVVAHNGSGRIHALLSAARGTRGALARERAVAHFKRSLEIGGEQPEIRRAMAELEMYRYPGVQVVRDQPAEE